MSASRPDRPPVAGVCALPFYRLANLIVAATAGYLACRRRLVECRAYRLGEVSDTVLQTPQFIVRLAFPVGMAHGRAGFAALRVVGRRRGRKGWP